MRKVNIVTLIKLTLLDVFKPTQSLSTRVENYHSSRKYLNRLDELKVLHNK